MAIVPERNAPQLSANALGEYLASADPSERRRILRESKFRSGGMYHYVWAMGAATQCMLTPEASVSIREKILKTLGDKLVKSPTPQGKTMARNNIHAVRKFETLESKFDFQDVEKFGIDNKAKIIVRDVIVSVRPELMIRNTHRQTFSLIKLRFSIKHLSPDASRFVALLLGRYGEELESVLQMKFDRKSSYVVGVIENEILGCADPNPRKFSEIEVGCDEVRNAWQLLKPPTARRSSAQKVRPPSPI